MAIAGGLSGQVGLSEESTFGTYVVPTRFYELTQESIKYSRERIESKGLRTGRRTVDRWVAGRQGGEGDVEFDVLPNGFGIIAKHMLGAVTTSTPGGATNARLHTAKVGALDAKSLTVQFGRTGRGGTTDPYSYTGCKLTDWELTMQSDGVLSCKLGMNVQGEDTATALATASYPATNVLLPFSDTSTSITIGGTSYDVDKVTVSGKNALATDRYHIGAPTKLEQLEGKGLRDYGGTIDLESYAGLTPYNLFVNGTEAAIVCTFSGATIEAALKYMVRVTLPRCRFDGETTTIGGPDLLPQSIPFKALYTSAATTEVQIEVQNTDTAA